MNTIGLGLMGLLVLLLASLCSDWRQRAATDRHRGAIAQTLRDALELLQLLQKHRGLGGQTAVAAQQQRRAVARQLDQLLPRAAELGTAARQWPVLKEHPDNFVAHSRVIETVLSAIALAEQRLQPLAGKPADGAIAAACHRLEDLARLRGLAARAAAQAQCPLDLQVQLRYLCQRLQNDGAGLDRDRVRQALRVIAQQLLDVERVAISPAACFELITPIIDDGVMALQRQMPV